MAQHVERGFAKRPKAGERLRANGIGENAIFTEDEVKRIRRVSRWGYRGRTHAPSCRIMRIRGRGSCNCQEAL